MIRAGPTGRELFVFHEPSGGKDLLPNTVLPNILASIPPSAETPFGDLLQEPFWDEFSNSFIVTLVVVAVILFLSRKIMKGIEIVPNRKLQNSFEALMVLLYEGLEGIVGKHMIRKTFPLLATIFLFTLISNWLGLVPGVGTIGFGHKTGFLSIDEHGMMPLFRPVMADLNMTLGMAAIFMIFWAFWTIQEVGIIGFLKHEFGPKGGLKGPIAVMLMPLFFCVGIIEMISIAFRPVSLSLRLFGNIFAGENLMHVMANLGVQFGFPPALSFIISVLLPIPFFFLELLVGVLQALVFTLLCAVYIQLSTSHDEEEHAPHAEGSDAHSHAKH